MPQQQSSSVGGKGTRRRRRDATEKEGNVTQQLMPDLNILSWQEAGGFV